MLSKCVKRGPLGILGEAMRALWFELNPQAATLSYYMPGTRSPTRTFSLGELEDVDINEHHYWIFLKFKGEFVRVRAHNTEDFKRWLAALAVYVPNCCALASVLEKPAATETPEMKTTAITEARKTHAFPEIPVAAKVADLDQRTHSLPEISMAARLACSEPMMRMRPRPPPIVIPAF
jgi:hypothetical protein